MRILLLLIFTLPVTTLNAQTVTIPDANFLDVLVNGFVADLDGFGGPDGDVDTNGDGLIQVAEAEAVFGLWLDNYDISSVQGIESFVNLDFLSLEGNNLTELDLSSNTLLVELECSSNELTTVNISQCPNLTLLNVNYNQLSQIDVSNNANLIIFNVTFNNLTSIDVSQNLLLESLGCFYNQLSGLIVSNNTALKRLSCQFNQIQELDVSNNPELIRLLCFNNLISSLDVSSNSQLKELDGQNNQLNYLNINNGNNTQFLRMYATSNPDLSCIQVDDVTYSNNQVCENLTPLWCKDDTAEYSENCGLSVSNFSKNRFKLYPNPVEDILFIEDTSSNNNVLSFAIYNQLGSVVYITNSFSTSLDLSNLTSGLYFCEIRTDKGKNIYKILKK